MTDLFSLEGKTAIVTGGGRGIGEMLATGLVEAGVTVWISSRKQGDLDEVAKRLGDRCIPFAADLSDPEGCTALAEAFAAQHDRLDILVNNAGAAWGAPFEDYPAEAFDRVMNVNVKGIFVLTQALLPQLRAAATSEDPARVVNIGSIDGIHVPFLPNYAYSASKAAVHQLTRHTAKELASDHITVNAIAPGFFPTRMTAFAGDEGMDAIAAVTPLERVGTPEDIVGLLTFMCSRAGAFMTGAIVPLDGGLATVGPRSAEVV